MRARFFVVVYALLLHETFFARAPHGGTATNFAFLHFFFCNCSFNSTAVESSMLQFQTTKSYVRAMLFLQGLCMGRGYIFCNLHFFLSVIAL